MKNKDTLFVLNASKSNKTKNNYIYLNDHKFNKEIIYSGPRIGLSDKHMEWKTINYRFVIMKPLIKKQKRSLVELE